MEKVLRVTKQAADSGWQFQVMNGWDPFIRPNNLRYENGVLSYDFIDGSTNHDWYKVVHLANHYLWEGEGQPLGELNRLNYVKYMSKYNIPGLMSIMERWVINGDLTVPKSGNVHGDLTLYNTIGNKFIDPSPPRLPCIEIDLSKIMQSLDGFGVVFRNEPQPMAYPKFETRPELWCLLLTHYIRMIPHISWHELATDFAQQRIKELLCVLRPIS